MQSFFRSKTTWLAIGTILFHIGAVLLGTSTVEQAVQACVTALGAAFLRDGLRAHAAAMAETHATAGVGIPLADGGGD